jgi:hypothetical protein
MQNINFYLLYLRLAFHVCVYNTGIFAPVAAQFYLRLQKGGIFAMSSQ